MTIQAINPFHEGERRVQRRYGREEKMAAIGPRVIRPFMPDQHRDFYTQLPWLVVGAQDNRGDIWASMLFGKPGFVASPTPTRLNIQAKPLPGDPIAPSLVEGGSLGILGIELHTRRRNRVNGRLETTGSSLEFKVDQSFGNCPKYINIRNWPGIEKPQSLVGRSLDWGDGLAEALVKKADTFFIASAHQSEDGPLGVDVSHRGGAPGFVRVLDDGDLLYPDYSGNFFFNTIGNLVVDSRSGYLFPDFETGSLLMLTGRTQVIWEPGAFEFPEGAQRLMRFRPEKVIRFAHESLEPRN